MGDKFQADAVTRRALELMHKGFHGGPAVMTVCQETFKWPEKANWAAINFMVGVGGYQFAPCGSLSAAAAALGMMFGKDTGTREQAREARRKARSAARCIFEDFRREFGSTVCRGLVKVDFDQPGAFEKFVDEGGFEQKCDRYVSWVVNKLLNVAQEEGVQPAA